MVLSMDRWVGKVAVVTGASAGIGATIAEHLVDKGVQVVALARRKDKLDELTKKLTGKRGKLFAVKADVSKEEDILNAFKWIKENLGPVRILVNNAGVFHHTNLTDGDTELWKNTLDVNVIGLCVATREAVKDMKANSVDGHIIHINSISGHQIIHWSANIESPSKYAVTALTETLRLELNSLKLKIKVTSISPGLIDTEEDPDALPTKRLYEESKILEPEQIADAVIYALSTPPHVQIQQVTVRPVIDFALEDLGLS